VENAFVIRSAAASNYESVR